MEFARVAVDGFLQLMLLMAGLAAVMPLSIYWHRRQRHWCRLLLALSLFLLLFFHFSGKSRGGGWDAFFGSEILFGLLYLPLLAWAGINRLIQLRIAGKAPFTAPLRPQPGMLLVLIGLALVAQLVFFVLVRGCNLICLEVLQRCNWLLDQLYRPYHPLDLTPHADAANMLIAALPVSTLVMAAQAWFRKRQWHGLPAVPACISVTLTAALAALLL